MYGSKAAIIVRQCISRSLNGQITNRCKTTHRNSQDHGNNIFDKSQMEKLKYKQKDKFFEKGPEDSITKSDKDMLRDFLQDGKKVRKPEDLEDVDKVIK